MIEISVVYYQTNDSRETVKDREQCRVIKETVKHTNSSNKKKHCYTLTNNRY